MFHFFICSEWSPSGKATATFTLILPLLFNLTPDVCFMLEGTGVGEAVCFPSAFVASPTLQPD